MFLPRATSSWGNSPLSGEKKKQLGLLMQRGKHEIGSLLPQVGRGNVAPRITLDNWHWVKNIGVTKSWDQNLEKKKK